MKWHSDRKDMVRIQLWLVMIMIQYWYDDLIWYKIRYDMIWWYDMIRYDMIWYDYMMILFDCQTIYYIILYYYKYFNYILLLDDIIWWYMMMIYDDDKWYVVILHDYNYNYIIWYDMVLIWCEMNLTWYESDMIWYYDMICFDGFEPWFDSIWFDMTDMIGYNMIWYDLLWSYDILIWMNIWYFSVRLDFDSWNDLIWYDLIRYDMIWFDL
jgi:hypothetical protein